jgi:hypothetical protein
MTIAGSLVTAVFCLCVWFIQRRIQKGDAFRDAASRVLQQLEESKSATEFADNYKASVPAVRDSAAAFRNYIFSWKRQAFDIAWRSYCRVKDDSAQPKWDIKNYPDDLSKILFDPTKIEAREDILRWLRTMIALSNRHT